jgi:hypothetical protein
MDKDRKLLIKVTLNPTDKVEGLVRQALQVGEENTGITDIFSGLDDVLNDDFRHPIPMGIPGIDRLLKVDLSKGQIWSNLSTNRSW